MKKASGIASEEDFQRIDAILELEPGLKADFEQWHRDMPALRGMVCLAAATEEDRHELPEHIQEQLRARMRAALRRPQPNYDRLRELINEPPNPKPSWRWALAPAAGLATIVVISLLLFNNRPPAPSNNPATAGTSPPPTGQLATPASPVTPATPPVIQVALLDTVGVTRGAGDSTRDWLRAAWPGVALTEHSRRAEAREWLAQWPSQTGDVCKIFYDQGSGELQLIANLNGQQRTTSFALNDVSELPQLIQQAKAQLDVWLQEKENSSWYRRRDSNPHFLAESGF